MSEHDEIVLQPCPFCGGTARLIEAEPPGGWVIECERCHASSALRYSLKEDARPLLAEQWNRRREIATLTRERDEARAAIERDRTNVAEVVNELRRIITGRSWMREGRGSYAYDDDRWKDEFGEALDEISAAADHLQWIAGDWTNCPMTSAEVKRARQTPAEARAAAIEEAARVAEDGQLSAAFFATVKEATAYNRARMETATEIRALDPRPIYRSLASGESEEARQT